MAPAWVVVDPHPGATEVVNGALSIAYVVVTPVPLRSSDLDGPEHMVRELADYPGGADPELRFPGRAGRRWFGCSVGRAPDGLVLCGKLRRMPLPTHLPDDGYLRKVGLVVYLVSSLEGLLLLDLPRLETAIPAQLSVEGLAGKTTLKVGLELVKYAPQCSRRDVETYLEAGGNALLEVAPQRNALLHARPATDEHGPVRLFQRRLLEAHLVNDTWLDRLVQRIGDLQVELNGLRPSSTS